MTGVKLSPDGSTITVFVPIGWRRCGGRKVILVPRGCDDWSPPPKIDRALVKALARAHRWQLMLDDGVYSSVSEIGDTGNISRSYVRRNLRFAPRSRHRRMDPRRAADHWARAVLAAVSVRVGEAAEGLLWQTTAARVSTASDIPEILGERTAFNYCKESQPKIWEGGQVRRCLPPFFEVASSKRFGPPLSLAHIPSIMSILPGRPGRDLTRPAHSCFRPRPGRDKRENRLAMLRDQDAQVVAGEIEEHRLLA
jgi:hypothetical protein